MISMRAICWVCGGDINFSERIYVQFEDYGCDREFAHVGCIDGGGLAFPRFKLINDMVWENIDFDKRYAKD